MSDLILCDPAGYVRHHYVGVGWDCTRHQEVAGVYCYFTWSYRSAGPLFVTTVLNEVAMDPVIARW